MWAMPLLLQLLLLLLLLLVLVLLSVQEGPMRTSKCSADRHLLHVIKSNRAHPPPCLQQPLILAAVRV